MAQKNKIAFFGIHEWEKKYLRQKLKGFKIYFFEEELNEDNAGKASSFSIISIFAHSKIDKKVIDNLKNAKIIATRTTGFDHIDLIECKKKKIIVCNVPRYGENTVAEHTFALILCLTRKIHKAWDRTRHLDFSIEGLRGIDLRGKTLGVVGTGSIGKHVIRIAKGFEMNVIAYDVFKDLKAAKELGFSYAGFDNLLKNSDIITLHTPYNEKTHHMINKKNIGKIKKGAILINTARGALVETDALVKALDSKILSGAGLDVLEEECFVQDETEIISKNFPKECNMQIILENHILATKENVIITPHNAFNSSEALQRILEITIENIKGFRKGNVVNRVA